MPKSAALRIAKIALIGVSRQELDELNRVQAEQLQNQTVVKPTRMFGAVWTSDKVAQRNVVVMCEECRRKYQSWWKKAEYRPDWGWRYVGDCDGCSTKNIWVTLFHAEECFYNVLGPAHGRNPKP